MMHCPASFPNTSHYYIQHINPLESHTDAAIYSALQSGPVGVGVCGTQEDFMLYGGGVYDNSACCGTLNHAMLIVGVGYDRELGVDYWVVMNR
ncbi:hypothetical protein EON63_01500 [archaeon]|nr:MAG: hypothetical protein EON63_01500 [archaeon]